MFADTMGQLLPSPESGPMPKHQQEEYKDLQHWEQWNCFLTIYYLRDELEWCMYILIGHSPFKELYNPELGLIPGWETYA